MPRSSRSPVALLQAFVATRRGLRLASVFGDPGVFVGRRLAIRLRGQAIEVRLTPAGRDLAQSLVGHRMRRGAPPGWVHLPAPASADHEHSYLTVFECAVRDVAIA